VAGVRVNEEVGHCDGDFVGGEAGRLRDVDLEEPVPQIKAGGEAIKESGLA
jgi:hypothetical protein